MDEDRVEYPPASPFLQKLVFGGWEVPSVAEVAQVVALTRDADSSNRDWAMCLLANSDLDTPAVRAALWAGLDDTHHETRAEALIGVARREPKAALPAVRKQLDIEIRTRSIASMTIEAAACVADPALAAILRDIRADIPRDGPPDSFDSALDEAIDACERGEMPDWRRLDIDD